MCSGDFMENEKVKVIDFEKKGNVIRLFLGDVSCNDYWGDDWNDSPYEHNAGTVYDEYVRGYMDIAVPFDCAAVEASSDWVMYHGNTPYCKDDFKHRIVPCIIICPEQITQDEWAYPPFSKYVSDPRCFEIFYNDILDDEYIKKLQGFGVVILENVRRQRQRRP